MKPTKMFLCGRCYCDLRNALKLTPLGKESEEKEKCDMCRRKEYGRIYVAEDKE